MCMCTVCVCVSCVHMYVQVCVCVCVCLCMLSKSLPVYQVRLDWLPLPYIALIRPSQLSCLGSSVG